MIQKLLLIIRLLFLKFSNSFSGKLFIPNVKLLFFGIFFVFSNNYGQSASNYCFTTSTGTYNTLAGVSGVTNAGGMPTSSTDDVISNPITMPFVFTFGGLGYNQVKISNNGWLTFGSATDSQYANTSANAESSKPILFPFWDDLVYANNNPPRYLTTGSSPNRIFKIEWVQQYFYNGNTGDMLSFQVWLYEGSNKIEYRYKTTSNNVGTTITSSIGIYDSNSTYLTLNNAGANPTAQTGTFTTNINARPANNQIYTFTPDVTTSLGSYEFCIDKTNTQTTGNASAGQYALVNVIKGFKYTFAVGDVFSGFSEKLNILDASTGLDVSPAATNSSATGATITNWEPQFSGQVKVVLSTGTCAGIGTVGTGGITLTLNSVGNKQDSQISTPVANNTWRGHIYNWTSATLPPGGASPPALPTTTPFSDAEYVGYYDETTESITKNFGGDDVCFPILSNDVQRATIRTEQFAVRYRMNSTKSGCYLVTLRADDGVRLYVDGVRVATQWGDQSATTYSNVLINLTGTSVLVLDYYENAGVNILEFSMTPFLASSNTITAPASTTVCTGTAPGLIDGSSYPYNGAAVNPTIKFQWESAPQVSGAPGTWTNVTTGTGITAEDYTPAAIIGNTSTNVTYYRRTVSAVASNASTCSYSSAPISITTNPKPVISNMTTSACSGTTFTVTPTNGVNGTVPTGTTYSWGAPTGTNFSGGQASTGTQSNISGTLSTTTTATATATYTITPTTGGCPGNTFTIIVTLNPLPTISGTLNVCAGSTTSLTGLGTPNSTNPWTSSSTSVATVSNTGVVTGVAAGTSVITYTNNNGCSVTANITVNPLPSTPTVGTITNVSCASLGSVVLSNLPAGNWTITQTGFASASYSPIPGTSSYTVTGLAAGGYYFTVNNGTCTSTQTALVTIGDQPTVTWNGTTWLGGTPDATKKAIVTSVTP
ncbi:PKD-like domain-containing protein, partial [Flavobacterium sp. FlaQc-48]|uniref:PKD-like domain-containing protein n=1 Tax=Flavobacterium sp. FlaQc-48 TaxID=3374181 RepID=UPI003757DF87